MGRTNSGRGKRRTREPFIAIPKTLVRSPAWQALPKSAHSVYLLLLADKCRNDQIELRLTYPQAQALGISSATMSRSLKALQKLGFIIKTKHGGLEGGESVYVLSQEWRGWQPKK